MILQLFPFRMFFLLVCSTSSRMLYRAHLWTPCLPSIFLSLTLFSIILSKVFRLHFFFLIEFFLFHSGIVLSYFFFKKEFSQLPKSEALTFILMDMHTYPSFYHLSPWNSHPATNESISENNLSASVCVCMCLQACMCLHMCLCMCMLLSPPPLVWQLMSREASCALLPVPLRVSIIAPNRLRRYLLNQS